MKGYLNVNHKVFFRVFTICLYLTSRIMVFEIHKKKLKICFLLLSSVLKPWLCLEQINISDISLQLEWTYFFVCSGGDVD